MSWAPLDLFFPTVRIRIGSALTDWPAYLHWLPGGSAWWCLLVAERVNAIAHKLNRGGFREPHFLLRLLQRLCKFPKQVEQLHSSLITGGHLLVSDLWINTLLYNTLIRAHLNLSAPRTSLLLFVDMLRRRAPPNSHTLPSVLKAAVSIHRASPLGSSLNAQSVRRGLLNDPFVRTSFISLYSAIGDLRSARNMFDEIPQPCVVSCNAMLDAFGKSGDMCSAISLFSSMPERDVYSWTSVISGYARSSSFVEAVRIFRQMMADEDVRPNEATFVSVLSSCANVDEGKQIHGYVVRNERDSSVFVGTTLIAFYGKMGFLKYALRVFDEMPVRRTCTWNAVICSLGSNGMEIQALEMFEKMKNSLMRPNEVTFVGVLSACARKKLVDLGLDLFRSMSIDFGITPTMEHYGCVVDLLGRAGLLKEAYEFVTSMPFEANASVLGALLGACRVHGDVGLGNEVGRNVIELHPGQCGKYVLLSSIYAETERWDQAAAVRKAMAHAGIQKVPAFSVAD